MKARLISLLLAGLATVSNVAAAADQPVVVDRTDGNSTDAITLQIDGKIPGRFALSHPQRMRVYAVDDIPVKDSSAFAKVFLGGTGEKVDEVRLLPGKHRILLHATGKIGCGWAYLWFVAEPETRYVAKFEFNRLAYRVWIEEMPSGRPVGGMVGADDEPEPRVRSQEMYDATRTKCY